MAESGSGGLQSILYVCDFNAHGGTQTHLLHLFHGIDRRRYRPFLATLNLHPDLARKLGDLDIEVTDLMLKGAFRPGTLRAVGALARQIRRRRVNLLHGLLYQGNILTAALSTLTGAPCITSVRNLDLWKRARHRAASGLAHRMARRVVFNSSRVRDHTVAAERIPKARTVVIPNGVADLKRSVTPEAAPGAAGPPELADPTRPTAVCVASLRRKKGHEHLLEAFRQVLRQIPSARLVLVGEGPLRRSLTAEAFATGLDGAVIFTGYRPDVSAILEAADVFVLSSLEEGMPNALLEAMSAGLPCVVTDAGGNAEVVVEGGTGYLVPPGQPGVLAERLAALLSDPELRQRQGAAARSRFESSFTIEKMASAYHGLYAEVLDPSAAASRP